MEVSEVPQANSATDLASFLGLISVLEGIQSWGTVYECIVSTFPKLTRYICLNLSN